MKTPDGKKTVFQYRFSPAVVVLLAAGAILSAAGTAMGIVTAIGKSSLLSALPFILTAAFSLLLLLLSFSALVYSRYVFQNGELVFINGLIRSAIPIGEIAAATFFRSRGKLALYYADGKYSVLSLRPEEIDPFTNTLLHLNPSLPYSVTSDPPTDKTK